MSVTISGAGLTFKDASTQNTAATGFGFKNRIINGAMQVAQRATSATITAGSTIAAGYSTVDRFYVYCTGANVTAAQVAGSGSVKNRLQITGAPGVTAVGIGQRIEQLNSYDLVGSTCTLSADIANTAVGTVTWAAYYANTADTFGTLASPTRTQIATGTFSVTSTITNFSTQISIPSAATTGIEIVFTVGAQITGTWTIGNIQLEKGSTATSFDYRPYGTELALCQRYYQVFQYFFGFIASTTSLRMSVSLPVVLRATPSVSVSATASSIFNPGGASGTPGAVSGIGYADNIGSLFFTLASSTLTGASTGQSTYCGAAGSASSEL